ncbi:MAG: ROK family protein [Acidobacteriota bacterium]
MSTLAIDIGGTKFALGLFEDGRLVRREERPTNREAGPTGMMPEILAIARAWQADSDVTVCGVGFGGPVNFADQRVALSTHADGWNGYELRDRLQNALGILTIIDNDANAGALGEALVRRGA